MKSGSPSVSSHQRSSVHTSELRDGQAHEVQQAQLWLAGAQLDSRPGMAATSVTDQDPGWAQPIGSCRADAELG